MNSDEALKLEKAFSLRRAGLAPADPAADKRYCDILRVTPSDCAVPGAERPLTDAERHWIVAGERHRVQGQIFRVDQLGELRTRSETIARLKTHARATTARREFERLQGEAERFG